MPLANASFIDLNDVATWNCGVTDIQLGGKGCDVILQTRVTNHEHAGNSQDLFYKGVRSFYTKTVKYYTEVKIKTMKVKHIF
jgi:hypothetical protein